MQIKEKHQWERLVLLLVFGHLDKYQKTTKEILATQ
jgi:hypothetical protein